MPQMDFRHILRKMLEIQVVKLNHGRRFRSQAHVAVRRKEKVGLELAQESGQRQLEIPYIKKRMTRLRKKHNRLDILCKDEFRVGFAVKDKIKLHIRMRHDHAPQGFISHPTDAFQSVFQQQTCIYYNFQINQIKTQK